ncbi:MAG: hypothetical protein IJG82_09280 [Atopobiaceae bacterium]|nr:hypothetical protein [Atopobiaceae bacterium]
MNDMTLSDIAAVTGNNRDGFGGGDGAWWLLVLFALLGGFGNGNGGGWGNGGGYAGGDALYPWMQQQQNVNDGFRDQMLNTQLSGIQQGIITGFGDVQNSLCNGFNQTQMGMLQGFNGVQAQIAQQGYDNQLAIANQTSALLTNQTQNTQNILDKLCQLELDGYKRENSQLQAQLNAANLAASQAQQNTLIQQGFANEVDALYNRLNNCPVPSMPVYGRTPIFTCQSQNGCGCGA